MERPKGPEMPHNRTHDRRRAGSVAVRGSVKWPPPQLRPASVEARLRSACGRMGSEGGMTTVGAWPRGLKPGSWPSTSDRFKAAAPTGAFILDSVSFSKHAGAGQLNPAQRTNSHSFHHGNMRGRAAFGSHWKTIYNPQYKGELPTEGISPAEWASGANWNSKPRHTSPKSRRSSLGTPLRPAQGLR